MRRGVTIIKEVRSRAGGRDGEIPGPSLIFLSHISHFDVRGVRVDVIYL